MPDERILARLPELPVLHLSLNVRNDEIAVKLPRLVHTTRIMGSLAISAMPTSIGGVEQIDVQNALWIINQANALRDKKLPPCQLVLAYYPWWSDYCPTPNAYTGTGPYLDCDCDTTAGCIDDPRQTCHDDDVIDEYEGRIDEILGWLADEETDESIIAWQVFDTERWYTINEQSWDAAVTNKHDRFYDAGKGKLPSVPIHQYDRAAVAFVDHPTTHAYSRVDGRFYKLDESGDATSLSLYQLFDLKRSKKMMEATAEAASETIPEGPVIMTPWIGLACGFPELGTTVPFRANLDYGLRHVRDMAHYIRNVSFGSYPRVVVDPVALYPSPFDPSTPLWLRYFIEWVRASTE